MINPMDLTGSRILVTGAGSGIGREVAMLLSQLGARVVLAGRRLERLQETAALLEGDGHLPVSYDLGEALGIPAWIRTLTQEGGPFDGMVHMAGVHSFRPLRSLDPAYLDQIMQSNLGSAVALARGLRQKDCCRKPASLVFTASVAGLTGVAGASAYSASKGALIALTRSLALELAREEIRVNCLAPGFVETPMTEQLRASLLPEQFSAIEAMHPLGLGQPRDVAHAAAFLLAPTGRWITGSTLVIDGGYTSH